MKPTPDYKPNKLSVTTVSGAKETPEEGRRKGTSRIIAFVTSSPHRWWLFGLFLVAATLFAYQPAWNAGFIWDDDLYVTKNPLLSAPDGLWRIWFSMDSPSQYFPLAYTAFRMEHALWGFNPVGYHWVNILLHAINALLVWRVLYRLGVPGSWLAAALFALHPVQVESVAWITELKSILSLFFILLTLLAWMKFMQGQAGRWWFYLLASFLYVLALSAKSTACTLPAALVLILWLKRKPIDRFRLVQIVPFAMLALGSGLLTMWWERYHQHTEGNPFAFGLLDRILIASHAAWFYAGKLLWPSKLTFSYPLWHIDPSNPLQYAWLIAGAALAGGIYFARRWAGRSIEVATLFYLATLAPTMGFIMLYTFVYSFVADHYQYVACIGPFALASAAITLGLAINGYGKAGFPVFPLFGRRFPWLGWGLCTALVLGLSFLTWRQCRMYEDQETLWHVTCDRNPGSAMAHNNLGFLLLQKGEVDDAIRLFRQALEINPNWVGTLYGLGNAYVEKGQLPEAVDYYQRGLKAQPQNAIIEMKLAATYLRQGDVQRAVAHYKTITGYDPNNLIVLNNLAWLLATSPDAHLRDGNEAVQLAERGCQLTDYQQPQLIGTLAAAYAEVGRFDDAVASAQQAYTLALSLGQKTVALKNQELLQLYKARQPCREQAVQPPPTEPPAKPDQISPHQ